MRPQIFECDPDGYLVDEYGYEDVMDLDHTEVLNFLDVNHTVLPASDPFVGFYESMENRLDALEELENEEMDSMVSELLGEIEDEG